MSGINKAVIVGRLGKDPELKELPNGSVTNFTVATSEKWSKDGEEKERTEWHRISCFGKLAELTSKYLSKGRQVYVEGKLRTRSYDKDGITHYTTDIIADRVEFLGDAKKAEADDAADTASDMPPKKEASAAPKARSRARRPAASTTVSSPGCDETRRRETAPPHPSTEPNASTIRSPARPSWP